MKSGNESKSAENVARMVFSFVSSAKAFTEGMDESDEVKLLRLRTRRNEIVIVPGTHISSSEDSYCAEQLGRSKVSPCGNT